MIMSSFEGLKYDIIHFMTKKQWFTTIVGLLLLAAFIIGGIILKQKRDREIGLLPTEEQTETQAHEVKVVVKSIRESNMYYDINAEYPQFEGVAPIFNQTIEKTVTDAVADHKNQSEDNQKYLIDLDRSEGREPRAADQYQLYVKYEQAQVNPQYISLVMRIGGYTGGAHGYENVVTFNYDVANQEMLMLSDLFPNDPNYLTTLSDYSRQQLRASLGDYANETFIVDGTNPTVENFKNFTFTDDAITIYFTQYQVAPYVAGEQRIIYRR